jgi:hypothetical protein
LKVLVELVAHALALFSDLSHVSLPHFEVELGASAVHATQHFLDDDRVVCEDSMMLEPLLLPAQASTSSSRQVAAVYASEYDLGIAG